MFGWSCQTFLATSGSLCSLRDTGSFLSIRVSREGSREDNCGAKQSTSTQASFWAALRGRGTRGCALGASSTFQEHQ